MAVDIAVPQIGESITEGYLAEWLVGDGGWSVLDQPLFVLETDKATMTVAAAAAGKVTHLAAEGDEVTVGQVIGTIDTEVARPEAPADAARTAPPAAAPAPSPEEPATDPASLSPAVRRQLRETGVDLARVKGTGPRGRINREDVLRATPSAAPPPPAPSAPTPAPAVASSPEVRQTREPMSRLRQRIAERLVQVQQTTALLTTFNEVDMSRVMALRAEHKERFKEVHGVGLGFMSFFVKAVVQALRDVPEVNATIEGTEVVRNHYYDIGIAVSTERGLVVPVLRDADQRSMAEIESGIAALGAKARDRRLELSDLQGAVFTISNGGVFGSLMSTPILNPPGSAILGMHAIKQRPIVVDDQIVARPMMYLALTYDHRLIDGREAVTFLKRIVEGVERPERIWLGI